MKIKFFATYREITRRKEEDFPAPENMRELLNNLCERYPGFREKLLTPDGMEVGGETIIMVNGRNIDHLDGIKTPLAETDTVSVFPVVAGG